MKLLVFEWAISNGFAWVGADLYTYHVWTDRFDMALAHNYKYFWHSSTVHLEQDPVNIRRSQVVRVFQREVNN